MRGRSRRSVAIFVVVIVAVVLALHGSVIGYDFVFDDHWTIERNSALAGPLRPILAAVFRGSARSAGIPDATRPTMIVSMWIDRHLFGLAHPSGFHVHSLVLYALVCLVAGWLAFLVLGRLRAAFVAALFFAVAPIHGEVVAAINYREDLLSTLGVFVALGALLSPVGDEGRAKGRLATTVAVTTTIAVFAKESALALVPLLLATIAIRRVAWPWVRRREAPLVSLALVLVAYLNWRLTLGPRADDLPRAPLAPLAVRLLDTARFEVQAVVRALVPLGWSPDPARPAHAAAWWIAPAIGALAVVVFLARRRTTRPLAFGLTLALTAPVVASPLLGPFNAYADRYLFASVLGGAIVWGWLFDRAARHARWVAIGFAAAGLTALAWDARRSSGAWRDDRTLWTTAVARDPDSARAWVALARVHRHAGELTRAEEAVARALALDRNYPAARLALVYDYLARGDVASAKRALGDLAALGDADLTGLRRARMCVERPAVEAPSCALVGVQP